MKTDMENLEVVGEASHGMVSITMTGEHRVKDVKINPECVDPKDVDGLQDLIRVAINDAVNKLEARTKNMEGMPNLGF
jgi:DNA-binding YbaB/EbfC family protein